MADLSLSLLCCPDFLAVRLFSAHRSISLGLVFSAMVEFLWAEFVECCSGRIEECWFSRTGNEEESFYVIEGEITFQIGDEKSVCGPGSFVHVPIGNLHGFKNESNQAAKMLITFSPSGIEAMFFENGKELDPGESPEATSQEEVERLLVSSVKFGIEYQH